jgi:hypothetical protein
MEKADGMFGTLVVSLPSKHEGGDVVATHKGESIAYSSSPGSDFGFSYAAWYSDITHEVKAVTSGYRLVLTYNLIHRPSVMSLENWDNTSAKLVSLLKSWAILCREIHGPSSEWLPDGDDGRACPTALLYLLDHEYTFSELSFTRLKGVDQGRAAEARKACKKADFSLFLVNVELTQDGEIECYEHKEGKKCDCDSHSMAILERDALLFLTATSINNAVFVQEDPFDSHVVNEYGLSGYMGNQPVQAIHNYQLTVKTLFHISRPGKRCFMIVFSNFWVSILNSTNTLGYIGSTSYSSFHSSSFSLKGVTTLFYESMQFSPSACVSLTLLRPFT